MADRKKYTDRNGFLHLEGTPISRVQVAPYLGKQIDPTGALRRQGVDIKDNQIYGVYRSPKELFDEDTMHSFDGMPFRVGHQMLGRGDGRQKSAKTKTVDTTPPDGCFFNVRRDPDKPDYLIADIVIYTDRALDAIAKGTKELSLGYRCAYVPQKGTHNGIPYDFVQTNITANHLALVPHGRAGSSVCVQDEALLTEDGLVVTCDSLPEEIRIMKSPKEKLVEILQGTEDEIQAVLDYCDLTEEQKASIKGLKGGEKAEVKSEAKEEVAEDKKDCGCDVAKDALPPAPPPPPEKPADDGEKGEAKAEVKEEVKTEGDGGEAKEEVKEEVKAEAPAADGCGGKKKTAKTYTQDELDKACETAWKKGRKDGIRAKILAEALGEDAADKTEAEIARDFCRKTKGLEFAADAADDVVLGAVRGHLAGKVAEADGKGKDKIEKIREVFKAEAEKGGAEKKEKAEVKEEVKETPAKDAAKKKLLTVAQDAAIAKTARTFNPVSLTKYLGTN